MRVFVTGATGLVGSTTITELLAAGHQVLGLARSEAAAEKLRAAGVEAHRGSLDDLDSLRRGASEADGVIHTAFNHDFSDFAASILADRKAVEVLAEELAGSDRPLVVTTGTPSGEHGELGTEETAPRGDAPAFGRFETERLVLAYAERGVRAVSVRLPRSVHGEADKHGFVPILIATARQQGFSAYPGDGVNRWPAVHVKDAARLYRLALEQAPAGTVLHAIGDEAVPLRQLAEIIGRHLDLPATSIPVERAAEHWGFIGLIFALDTPATSVVAQKLLDWQPTQPGLVADLEAGHYFHG